MKPTAYTVGNFKAIGDPQTLPIRPITLIFGQNSAGKSSIIQSLLLCQHALKTGSFDFSSIKRWGQRIDLGGFRQYIHKHESERTLRLAFTFGRDSKDKGNSPQEALVERKAGVGTSWSFAFLNTLDSLEVRYEVGLTKDARGGGEQIRVLKLEILAEGEALFEFTLNKKDGLEFALFHEANPALIDALASLLHAYGRQENGLIENPIDSMLVEFGGDVTEVFDERLVKLSEQATSRRKKIIDDIFGDEVAESEIEDSGLQQIVEVLENPDLFARCAKPILAALQEELKEPRRRLKIVGAGMRRQLDPMSRGPSLRHELRLSHQGGVAEDTGTALGATFEVEAIEDPIGFFLGFDASAESSKVEALARALRFDLELVIESCLESVVFWLGNTEYIGPYRSIPERFFQISKDAESDEVDQGYQTLRQIASDPSLIRRITEIFQDILRSPYRMEARIIAPSMDLRKLEEKLQRAREREKNEDGRSYVRDVLSEMSEGRTKTGLYLVDTRNDAEVDFCDVGFGISQVLPLIAELLKAEDGIICIEQPEVHLHPKMQSDLADIVIQSLVQASDGKQLIMETHSEHMILRLLRRIRESGAERLSAPNLSLSPEDLSVIWVEGTSKGCRFTPLAIDRCGHFIDDWPSGFFEERLDELF